MLLRINHRGGGFLQLDPPGGPLIFRSGDVQAAPDFVTWIVPEPSDRARAFTNFHQPTVPGEGPQVSPEGFACNFSPGEARWIVRREGLEVETRLFIPEKEKALVQTVSITNDGRESRRVTLVPVLRVHLAPFTLAPWDHPSMYQTTAFCDLAGTDCIWMETRDPGGDPSRRLRAVLLSDLGAERFEVSQAQFLGSGNWDAPGTIWNAGPLREAEAVRSIGYGAQTVENAAIGQAGVACLARTLPLLPGQTFTFSVAVAGLAPTVDGRLPPRDEVFRAKRFLDANFQEESRLRMRQRWGAWFAIRTIRTPDEAFNRYVNEWLPLQIDWVMKLDRGWASGMRGTRDAAQDTTGIIPLDQSLARRRLLEILGVQRSDGWFLRQYSVEGRAGRHDARDYVDAGCWVWEFLFHYLCYTRDWALLDERVGWLDRTDTATVLEHACRIFDYYLAPENLGEHGLCKIREGDWNDSVNRAGRNGRGESVMVSCQLVLALTEATELIGFLGLAAAAGRSADRAAGWKDAASRMKACLGQHAFNEEGYFNGVFNDAGEWIFSPRDPDGRRRVNGPVNAFAVIAGIVEGDDRRRVLEALHGLRGPFGWRLFHPPIGDPPIPCMGRIGAGDVAAGICENGTVYNHGSHGFLGRAACVAGKGDWFHEIMLHMLPYSQEAHPIHVQKTAPYAVVNHWKEAPGLEGHGGETFLSGSITTALRNVYDGMLGFRPELRSIVLDPVIPASWERLEATLPYWRGTIEILVRNPDGVESGVARISIDGQAIPPTDSGLHQRAIGVLPMEAFREGAHHRIEATLGRRESCS